MPRKRSCLKSPVFVIGIFLYPTFLLVRFIIETCRKIFSLQPNMLGLTVIVARRVVCDLADNGEEGQVNVAFGTI